MRAIIFALTFLLTAIPAMAETIAVIGTGNVGAALGPRLAAEGHEITYGSRNPQQQAVLDLVSRTGKNASAKSPADAAGRANIIILAVPGKLAEQIVLGLGDLDGKIIIDPTNAPLNPDPAFKLPPNTSIAELIQQAAPGSRVVKAFNTLPAQHMADPSSASGPVSIPLASDNDEAKAVVAELAGSIGLEPIDVGPLEHALWVEGMANLLIRNMFSSRQTFGFYLRPAPSAAK